MNDHRVLRELHVEAGNRVGGYLHVGWVEAEVRVLRYTMDVLKTHR